MVQQMIISITPSELQTLIIDSVKAVLDHYSPQTADPANQWLNIDELLTYHPERPAKQTVYQWLSAGTIPAHKKEKKVYFLKSEIDEWLASSKRITKQIAADEANDYLTKN
jgi:predicted DNA-binding transcriptional regulator AlpA